MKEKIAKVVAREANGEQADNRVFTGVYSAGKTFTVTPLPTNLNHCYGRQFVNPQESPFYWRLPIRFNERLIMAITATWPTQPNNSDTPVLEYRRS